MQVNLRHTNNLQFQANARGHAIRIDRPPAAGGDDAGMTPLELYLSALGSCVGFYILQYCQGRGLDTRGLGLTVSAQAMTNQPICEIRLSLPHILNAHHRKGIEQAVEMSLIHNTFIRPPKLITQIVATDCQLEHTV